MKYRSFIKRSWKKIMFCVIFVFLYKLINHFKELWCTDDGSVRQIELMCAQYHNREIVGDMCSTLCDKSAFTFLRCHGMWDNKKVIVMTCDGCIEPRKTSTVVLKIRYDMKTWQNSIGKSLKALNSTHKKLQRATKNIQSKMVEYYGIGLSQHNDLISLMLGENYNNLVRKLKSPNAIDVVLRTAISLGIQAEFLSHKVSGLTSFLPKLHGVCGPGYFVEYTPSFEKLNYMHLSVRMGQSTFRVSLANGPPWEDRAKAALSILRAIPQLEDNNNTILQFCDMTSYNLGLSESKEVVMLDSDSLASEQKYIKGTCNIHTDCRFYYCQGYCNQTTKLCTNEITVNNLQLMCRNILVTEQESYGLLRAPPSRVQEPLRKLLNQCMLPIPSTFKVNKENKSNRKLLRDIEMLLTSTL